MALYHMLFSKNTERNVNTAKIETQVTTMSSGKVFITMRRMGFSLMDTRTTSHGAVGSYQFSVAYVLKYDGIGDPDANLKCLAQEMEKLGGVHGWQFDRYFKDAGSGDTAPAVQHVDASAPVVDEPLDDSSIDLGDNREYFSKLYERNAQISVVLSAIGAAKDTRFEHRFHTVLWGPPGCGKTTITQGITDMVGEANVLKFDGPSSTKAGMEEFFLEGDDINPKVMIFEELEKADPEIHKVLLGMLDGRGEIRKTTGTDGQRQKDVRVLCIATVNNKALFDKVQAGSLSSRFTHKVFCPSPSRKCLESILSREIEKVKGNPAWIGPALDHVMGVEGSTDPRRALGVCLSGRDRLLDGSYQKALKSIHRAV